ncbi:MAG: 4-hydroxy-tetrahydrodipicolinate reductase [Dehalococcoidia bacterium]|nr:4-hydroxy-tetrahydrodipicolinate reductase [Dehalococcoidia bacterium]
MPESIRVIVSGSGKMGRAIIDALGAADGMTPVAVIEKFTEERTLAGPSGGAALPVTADPAEAFERWPADVVVDFTNALWTPAVIDAAVAAGVRPVIGTSGLADAYVGSLAGRLREQRLGGVLAANFALGAVLLMHLATIASKFFDSAEIIELHHDQKVDAPSGTAVATARAMAAARGAPFARNVPEMEAVAGARAAAIDGVTVHSVRLPGLVAHQEVMFGGRGQTLTLRHDTIGRESFMPGIILAAREVMRREELVVGLDALIGLA